MTPTRDNTINDIKAHVNSLKENMRQANISLERGEISWSEYVDVFTTNLNQLDQLMGKLGSK